MSRELVTVSPEASLRELAEILDSEGISGVPVVAGTRVLGVVSVTDLLRFESEGSAVPAGLGEARRGAEQEALERHTVSEAMTRSFCTLTPRADVHEAAEYMVRAEVHRLLVTRNLELVGIVTASDILRAVAERRL